MKPDYKPKSHEASLAIALLLAISAENNEQKHKAQQLVANIAAELNEEQLRCVQDSVEACLEFFTEAPFLFKKDAV